MTRRRVSIRLEQLVDVHERRQGAFVVWFCRLCVFYDHATDRSAALDAFAAHLAQQHRASGGHVRRKS